GIALAQITLQLGKINQAVLEIILVFPRITCVTLQIPGGVDLVVDTQSDLAAIDLSLKPDGTHIMLKAVQQRERTAITGNGVAVERIRVGDGQYCCETG